MEGGGWKFRAEGLGFRAEGSGFRVEGGESWAKDEGFRVNGVRSKV